MSDSSSTASGGIGFTGMLAILFIGLKLTDNIDWSWWWVLSPLWIPLAIVLTILGGIALVFCVIALIAACFGKKIARPRLRRRGW